MDRIQMQIPVLSDEIFDKLKKASEHVMSDIGFVVNNKTILDGLKDAGASVDYGNEKVKIAPDLLWELVDRVPSTYKVCGMTGDSWDIGAGAVYKSAIVMDPYFADYPSGEMRRPSLKDLIMTTRIIQSQPDVALVSLMDYPVTDVSGPASRYRALEAHLLNHAKPYAIYPTSYKSFMEWMDIGNIITRGGPLAGTGLFSSAIAVISPLTLAGENAKILLECLKYGFPLVPTVCPMAGSTSPYSFAGTLVQGIAENLVVLCCAQALNPGNPFIFLFSPSVTEMQSGRDLFYTIDKSMWKLASVQFAKRLGLPVHTETGGALNCRYDMQSGAEGMLMVLSAVMSGADLLAGSGSCLNANGLSPEFMLSHYAYHDAAEHLKNGYSMAELDRCLESIREQGCGGNFLTDDLTIEHLRDSEFFSHLLFDESGEHGGGASMLERAHNEALRIDESYISPVPEDIADALRSHFDRICEGFRGRGAR